MRAIDGTTVKEPGRSGSPWRIPCSVRLPSLACDFFKLTETEGPGTVESLRRFPVREGDCLLADRGHSTANGIGCVAQAGERVTVRANPGALSFQTPEGRSFDLLVKVRRLRTSDAERAWASVVARAAGAAGAGAGVRIRIVQEGLRRPGAEVLQWCGFQWQVELVFKRFKSLAQLGHLPRHDDQSAKAWLYGKLPVALLVEKLIGHALAVSPWGCDFAAPSSARRVA